MEHVDKAADDTLGVDECGHRVLRTPAGVNTKLAWGEWSGYHAAAVFADFVDIEYNAIREAAAVIDVTPLYKYEVGRHRRRSPPRPRCDP